MLHMNLAKEVGQPLIRLAGHPSSDGLTGAITITRLAVGVWEGIINNCLLRFGHCIVQTGADFLGQCKNSRLIHTLASGLREI